MRLKGKVAVVTGGGSGIGRATAKVFGEEGARVVVADVDARAGEETVKEICAHGGEAAFFLADVSLSKDAERLAGFTVERYGRIDILFNNVGIPGTQTVPDTPEEKWDKVMAVNLKSVYLCSKFVIPLMAKQGGGVIINTASAVGLVGSPNQAAYCASKGGVIALTKAMALDHAKDGIRVNCVCPGAVMTPMLERFLNQYSGAERENMVELFKRLHPLGRWAQPDEVARAVLFLASNEASFVTGAALPVDGGWTAQ